MTHLLPRQLLRAWQRHALCQAFTSLSGARLWCQLPGSHAGLHEHDEVLWEEEGVA